MTDTHLTVTIPLHSSFILVNLPPPPSLAPPTLCCPQGGSQWSGGQWEACTLRKCLPLSLTRWCLGSEALQWPGRGSIVREKLRRSKHTLAAAPAVYINNNETRPIDPAPLVQTSSISSAIIQTTLYKTNHWNQWSSAVLSSPPRKHHTVTRSIAMTTGDLQGVACTENTNWKPQFLQFKYNCHGTAEQKLIQRLYRGTLASLVQRVPPLRAVRRPTLP